MRWVVVILFPPAISSVSPVLFAELQSEERRSDIEE